MNDVEGLRWWQRETTLTPARAAFFGLALGWIAVTVVLIATPGGFSGREVLGYFLGSAFIGATSGYWTSLSADPVRQDRLHRATRTLTFLTLYGSLVFFPRFWWVMFATDVGVGLMILGFVCGMVLYVTAAAIGLAQLASYLASPRSGKKPPAGAEVGGVWDHDLDRGGPAFGLGG